MGTRTWTSNGSTVTVIDGNTCDATNHSGCGADPSAVTVGGGVSAVAVDQANNTVYVAESDGRLADRRRTL